MPTGGTSTSTTEWGTLYAIANSNKGTGECALATNEYDYIRCSLKLPLAGSRGWNDGQYYSQGSYGYYWSSSPSSEYSYTAFFGSGGGNIENANGRGVGFSLRCLKN